MDLSFFHNFICADKTRSTIEHARLWVLTSRCTAARPWFAWRALLFPHERKASCIVHGEVSIARAMCLTKLTMLCPFKNKGDVINMSTLPEAKLAREAELSYVLIATCESLSMSLNCIWIPQLTGDVQQQPTTMPGAKRVLPWTSVRSSSHSKPMSPTRKRSSKRSWTRSMIL